MRGKPSAAREKSRSGQSKAPKSRKVLSLFTGAGGLDLGLEAAGFEIAGCVELDVDAQKTLTKNRPDWKVALAWLIFLGSPLLFAFLGGYVGYRWRRGRPARPREG